MSRPRVTKAILERLDHHAVVQLVAPAGAGKTTAAAQAAEASGRQVAWLALAEWHRSPGTLLDDLVAALAPVVPGLDVEIGRVRASGAGPVELAALAGSQALRAHALLVVDDCQLVHPSADAVAVLAAVVRRADRELRFLFVGRAMLPLPGIGVGALDPDAIVGQELLRARREEAEAILERRHSAADVGDALAGTGGWIAGLVFESWRSREGRSPTVDPLEEYLDRELRSQVEPRAWQILVAASVFDEVDVGRAAALGADDPRTWLSTLRDTGVPAVWAPDRSAMRLHPRVRELLRAELRAGPAERWRSALCSAAESYEQSGELERALELYVEAAESSHVERLVPEVIVGIVERHDVELAERLLEAARLDPEPPRVILARLIMASIRAIGSEGRAVLEPLVREGRLAQVIADEPAIGALACQFLASGGSDDLALEALAATPPGRAADAGRLVLSLARDDPEAPVPPFTGDVVDSVLARTLYCRGRLQELRLGRTAWAESTGAHELAAAPGVSVPARAARFTRVLAQFGHAVEQRDLESANACVAELDRDFGGPWSLLAQAELAVRLERDPVTAHAAFERLGAQGATSIAFFRELASTWQGAALLLDDDAEAAASLLEETVASMRRGDRTLAMASALVYLAEAQWRRGDDEASDRASDAAYEVAHRQGSLRGLLLALADFPGVLSRRLDVEPAGEGVWHSLGRALVGATDRAGGRIVGPVAVHVREFGEPAIVVDGHRVVRPKIRKSLELLSYLLSSQTRPVSRGDVLAALWNGRDDESTRAYLRQALRHLRDVLPAGVTVAAVADALSIEGAVTSESLEFEALVAEAAREPGPRRLGVLLDALRLADRGSFLTGSNDVRWIDDRRSRIGSMVNDMRLDAAELLLDADRHLEALSLVRDALDADALLERGWRLRMRALGLLGDLDGVAAVYRACRDALSEIGLEPSRATVELARTFRR